MEEFSDLNPWWYSDNWKDKHIEDWESQKIKWRPNWIDEISLTPFSLNFIYGPRQTGKTTGLKIMIKELIEKGKDPKSIFYLDLDYIASFQELREIISEFIKEKRKRKVESTILILDEVTSVEDWWKIVKYYIDKGEFSKDVIIVSGSSSLGVTKSVERFPGRRGYGKEVLVLPLSFPQFVEVHGYKIDKVLTDSALALSLFDEYKKKGGFPKSINEHKDAGEALIYGIISEIFKAKREVGKVQDILRSIMTKIPSVMSFNSIANDLGISHLTVEDYVKLLKDIFLVDIAYYKVGNEVNRKKEKKIFFRDPFIYTTMAKWVHREVREEAMLEHIVQEHMLRKFGEVFYFKNNREIDVIANDYKIEIKKERSHKGYPKEVIVLSEDDIPLFLLREARG
ncbi:ATP-binding protein [Sulfurisphaera tokodaii]|uniref:AAA+ ATPase domain-containing protein n=2 Tax=Sulfurisphaera tokodaii TaxID=111955 RepID=Q972I8_SULTO|nr:ATP-binding protein [Sulfurisphaera tokodaii]BAB66178.1 hypothetical protein STK_11430 [Sulfurisphaera tokodaii str. 7]HII73025.1 ATP-binding protein [Sulfurisphaera tokodaii]